MSVRNASVTTYTKSTANIVDGNDIFAADFTNNFDPIELTAGQIETLIEDHETRFGGYERQNFIKSFDDVKVTTGTNTITVDGGATVANNVNSNYGITEVTGWANSGAISVTGIVSGIMWANTSTLLYSATVDTATRPANCLRVFTFTNATGVVTVNPKTFENATDADNHIFEGNIIFRGNFTKALPTNYHDIKPDFLTVATIKIPAGSRCRSTDDTKDIIFASDYTIDMSNATPTSTTGGRSVAEAASTTYYLYAGLDSANLPLAWFDTANLAAGGTPTNPAAYSSGRRQLRYTVFNNSASNISSIDSLAGYIDEAVISVQRVSGVATIDFTNIGHYSTYELIFSDVAPSVNGAQLQIRFSIDNGATYIATAGAYITQEWVVTNTATAGVLTTSTFGTLTQGLVNGTGGEAGGKIEFIGLRDPLANTHWISTAKIVNSNPAHSSNDHKGERENDEDNNAIRILISSGTVSGTFILRGKR